MSNTSALLDDVRGDITLFAKHAMKLHEAGPYAAIEVGYCGGNTYHVFIDGRYTGRTENTLEAAMVTAIAIKQQGPKRGEWMAEAAKRLLIL